MVSLTVVMYHYVRKLAGSDYPEIKGLETRLFEEQIKYILKFYNPVKMEEVIAAVADGAGLPEMPILLTFDDGYKDHSANVLPILRKYGIQGTFFIPGRAVSEKKVLDVNKIHFILACASDKENLLRDVEIEINERCQAADVDHNICLISDNKSASRRYDAGPVGRIKDLLQRDLPRELRESIVDSLFRKYVSTEEEEFSGSLYMNAEDIAFMKDSGMFIGSHSYDHVWMNSLDPIRQREELEKGLKVLTDIGCGSDEIVFSYPYGGYNESLLELLGEKKVRMAFTSKCDIAGVDAGTRYLVPRLDTNDLPKDRGAEPGIWTVKAMKSLQKQ
ncbi:MAG TPA: polysaccharide deacetylase family protein [Acidobacteriota bacterium]|nr:polysaccharide deacetylase family protein [Acidobacteriota bacterium]HNT17620.1 polysaccharide deacetylase family protein [Acidobacteriota bacterium]